jgi:hypothetical protein
MRQQEMERKRLEEESKKVASIPQVPVRPKVSADTIAPVIPSRPIAAATQGVINTISPPSRPLIPVASASSTISKTPILPSRPNIPVAPPNFEVKPVIVTRPVIPESRPKAETSVPVAKPLDSKANTVDLI